MMHALTDAPEISANDLVLAKSMADTLHKHYPGHFWAVHVDSWSGLATVRNMMLSGDWGFILKLGRIYSATQFDKAVVNAGGELLERYRVSRGRIDEEKLAYLPVDFSGQHKHD